MKNFFRTFFLAYSLSLFGSFETSMLTSYGYFPNEANKDKNWQILKSVFDSYLIADSIEETYLIPKLIHIIWLGSPLPSKCEAMVNSWKKFHPDWTVKIWMDEDIEDFDLRNQLAFAYAQNYGEKSDIFRYEILYRYGGLYVDTDFECLKPFDEIHRSCEFYAGTTYDKNALLYNRLIGARPGHPILKACVENLEIGNGDNDPFRIMEATGPYYLTKMYFQTGLSQGFDKTVVFPVTYLYPYPNNITPKPDLETIKRTFIKPESLAIHYWETSWAK